jgi:hypothetical protein
LNRKLPDASVMFHDAGAIAYYGDGRVHDMLGLVTNHQAGIANHGPGARFEPSLPASASDHCVLPGMDGPIEWYGNVSHTSLRRGIEARRLVGEGTCS